VQQRPRRRREDTTGAPPQQASRQTVTVASPLLWDREQPNRHVDRDHCRRWFQAQDLIKASTAPDLVLLGALRIAARPHHDPASSTALHPGQQGYARFIDCRCTAHISSHPHVRIKIPQKRYLFSLTSSQNKVSSAIGLKNGQKAF